MRPQAKATNNGDFRHGQQIFRGGSGNNHYLKWGRITSTIITIGG